MKRFFTMFSALIAVGTVSAVAQQQIVVVEDQVVVPTNPLQGNWFFDLGAGILYFNGNYASDMSFGKQLAPSAEFNVGKWFTPSIGARVGIRGLYLNTQSNFENYATRPDSYDDGKYDQRYNSTNIHGDMLFNVSQMFNGYNPYRIYSFIPYVGVGIMQSVNNGGSTDLTANLGLLNTFTISPKFNVYFDASAAIFKNQYTPNGVTRDYTVTASIGVTYKLGNRGWNSFKPDVIYTGVSQADFDALKEQLAAEKASVAALQSEVVQEKNTVAAVETHQMEDVVASPVLLTFDINSAELSNLTLVNLEYYAESIKGSDKDMTFTVVGYADSQTGSKSFNENLSRERADAVYSALTKSFGVEPYKLRIEYMGGVENMFYDDERLSRSVILKPNL